MRLHPCADGEVRPIADVPRRLNLFSIRDVAFRATGCGGRRGRP